MNSYSLSFFNYDYIHMIRLMTDCIIEIWKNDQNLGPMIKKRDVNSLIAIDLGWNL